MAYVVWQLTLLDYHKQGENMFSFTVTIGPFSIMVNNYPLPQVTHVHLLL